MFKYIYTSITVISLLYSCTKKELLDSNPRIELKVSENFIYSDTSISAGKQYSIGIIASSASGENLTNLIVESNGIRIVDKGFNNAEIKEDFSLTKTLDEVEIVDIIVRNKVRKSDTITLIIKKLLTYYLPISRYSEVLMGAQNNKNYGNYFSFSDSKIFTQPQAFNNQEQIDIVYFFDAVSDANTLASPGANLTGIITGDDSPEYWTVKNTTYYSREPLILSDPEFDNAENDSIIISNLFTNGGRKAKLLQNSQYYGIQTKDARFGILRIENVSGQVDGTIQFSVILQE